MNPILLSHRKAASIIEVVVSLGTMTVLMGLSLPGLAAVQRSAKETRCQNNLGRIAGAGATNAVADPKELLIPMHPLIGNLRGALGEVEWGGKSGIGEPQSGNDVISSKWGTQLARGPGLRALNKILFKGGFLDFTDNPGPNNQLWFNDAFLELDVYHCPSDYGYTGSHLRDWRDSKLTSWDHYGNSYSANTWWVGFPGSDCTLSSASAFLQSASRIPSPARTLVYEEHCGRYAWRQNYGQDGCQGFPGSVLTDPVIRGWHGSESTFNVAFADGHVARTYINGHLQPQPAINRYPDWNGYKTDYDIWHCVIIRGADWQKDTLPAPPVRYGIPCWQLP